LKKLLKQAEKETYLACADRTRAVVELWEQAERRDWGQFEEVSWKFCEFLRSRVGEHLLLAVLAEHEFLVLKGIEDREIAYTTNVLHETLALRTGLLL